MTDTMSRTEASAATALIGWRLLLGRYVTAVAVDSMTAAVRVAAAAVSACGADADDHLQVDARAGRVELTLQDRRENEVTARDVELAHGITDAVRDLGLSTDPVGSTIRPIQALELAIDTMNVAAILPFWRAVLGYVDEPGHAGPPDAVLDPLGQGPAIWFQQLDEPRPQRNRIHFDLTVAHDEADARVGAAIAAGGRLVSDAYARSFWILADADGNEVCVCTWQDRDDRQ